MNELRKFCADRKIPASMEDAFLVYCRSEYAQEYLLKKDGDTIKLVLEKMTQEQVLDAWNKFLSAAKSFMDS